MCLFYIAKPQDLPENVPADNLPLFALVIAFVFSLALAFGYYFWDIVRSVYLDMKAGQANQPAAIEGNAFEYGRMSQSGDIMHLKEMDEDKHNKV